MFKLILDKLDILAKVLVLIDTKVGFKKFVKYILLFLFLYLIANFRSIATETVKFIVSVSDEIHTEKMKLRDEYMSNLSPILVELRTKAKADRILYFEFHNSEQNLEGVPFKFFDLMQSNSKYSVSEVSGSTYRDVGAGMYPTFFKDLGKGKILHCNGDRDINFRDNYPGVYTLMSSGDHSKRQVFFGIPGAHHSIGFIALEWMNDSIDAQAEKINEAFLSKYLPRISAISVASKMK